MSKNKIAISLVFFWAIAIAAGFHALMVYKGHAGSAGKMPTAWPPNNLIAASSIRPQLVMFAHPRCPCTKASLGELELLVAQAQGKFDAAVLFSEPADETGAWSNTTTIDLARSIPGVRVILDRDGTVAKQFGAETSGHTVVYASNGKLLFSGGITGARGHLGDNGGFDSVLQSVSGEGRVPRQVTAKVFGCEIFGPCTNNQTLGKN
jgi:hypothetical protein